MEASALCFLEPGYDMLPPVKLEQRAPSSSSNAIKLKSRAMLATKSDLVVSTNIDVSFHILVCRQVLFSLEDITTPLPRAITNLLQEFKDVFPSEIPLRLPPLRRFEHQIDLTVLCIGPIQRR
jgi:hypothetical protein